MSELPDWLQELELAFDKPKVPKAAAPAAGPTPGLPAWLSKLEQGDYSGILAGLAPALGKIASGDVAVNPQNYRMFPPSPDNSPIVNILGGLASDTINLPARLMSGVTGLANWAVSPENKYGVTPPGAAPAPVAAAAPAPPVVPQMPTRGPTTLELNGSPFPAAPQLPYPPEIPAPPQQAIPPMADYSGVRKWLDAAAPKPTDPRLLNDLKTQLVMAGLFGGANIGHVASPDSIGRMWAGMGAGATAGGAKGQAVELEKSDDFERRRSGYASNRAGTEMSMANAQRSGAIAQQEVQYNNLVNAYKTTLANQNAKYETDVKNTTNRWEVDKAKWTLAQPKLHSGDGSVTIQETDPNTGKAKVSIIPTREDSKILDQVEKTSNLGWGKDAVSSPPRQMVKYSTLLKMHGNDPQKLKVQLIRETITDVIRSGAGSTVFGKGFEEAKKSATADPNLVLLASKPELYNEKLTEKIVEKLFGSVLGSGNTAWLPAAKQYSLGAGFLGN